MDKKMRKKIYSLYDDGVSLVILITVILEIMKDKSIREKAIEVDKLYFIMWDTEKENKRRKE